LGATHFYILWQPNSKLRLYTYLTIIKNIQ
jgi:hypothetical protein